MLLRLGPFLRLPLLMDSIPEPGRPSANQHVHRGLTSGLCFSVCKRGEPCLGLTSPGHLPQQPGASLLRVSSQTLVPAGPAGQPRGLRRCRPHRVRPLLLTVLCKCRKGKKTIPYVYSETRARIREKVENGIQGMFQSGSGGLRRVFLLVAHCFLPLGDRAHILRTQGKVNG